MSLLNKIIHYVTVEHSDGKMRLNASPAVVTREAGTDDAPTYNLTVLPDLGQPFTLAGVPAYDHTQHGYLAGGGFAHLDENVNTDWQDIPEAPEQGDRPQLVQPAQGGDLRRETPEEMSLRNAPKPGAASPARGWEPTTGQAEVNKTGPLPSQTLEGPNERSPAEPTPKDLNTPSTTDAKPMSQPATFNPSTPAGGGTPKAV